MVLSSLVLGSCRLVKADNRSVFARLVLKDLVVRHVDPSRNAAVVLLASSDPDLDVPFETTVYEHVRCWGLPYLFLKLYQVSSKHCRTG